MRNVLLSRDSCLLGLMHSCCFFIAVTLGEDIIRDLHRKQHGDRNAWGPKNGDLARNSLLVYGLPAFERPCCLAKP